VDQITSMKFFKKVGTLKQKKLKFMYLIEKKCEVGILIEQLSLLKIIDLCIKHD